MVVPKTPEKAPNTKYKIPISLWLVENNHLFNAGEDKEGKKENIIKNFSKNHTSLLKYIILVYTLIKKLKIKLII